VQSVWLDLRYALRVLGRQPAFCVLAVLTLGLGIGAATTIFSVVQNVLFDPFPGHNVDRVVTFQIHDVAQARPGGRSFFQVPEFLDYQEQIQSFEEVIAGSLEDVLYASGEGTEQFSGGLVTPNNFSLFGVPPQLGRPLTPEDARPGAPPVFVMSYKMWAGRFGADPGLLGRTFVLNDTPTTLVGIMPPRFTKLSADLYRPVRLDRADPEQSQRFFLFQARLKPGVTLRQAEAEIAVVAQRVAKTYPRQYPERFTVNVVTLLDGTIGQFRATLYTLAAAVGLLLLIACSNVANMLLARATTREREMALRASLGASRARLVRQMLVESFVLALAGAVVGCLFAYFGINALVSAIPDGAIPRQTVIRMNVPVLLFSLVAAAATAVLCGLVPALQSARKELVEPLKDSGKGTGAGARRHRLTSALVVAEIALSLVLMAGAGLLTRSFVKLQTVELGLNPEGVFHARLPLPRGQYKTMARKHQFFRQVVDRLRELPGVTSAAATSTLPPYGGVRSEVDVPGQTHNERWEALVQLVSEGYAETLGLRLRKGRFLSRAEVDDARKVAVVNQTLVQRYFGTEDPIGRTIELKRLATMPDSPVPEPVFEIVGVIADAKNQGLQDPILPEAFVPYTMTGAYERGILLRSSTPPAVMASVLKREVWAVDRGVALTMVGGLPDSLQQYSYAGPRFVLLIMGAFAALGLVLVALGVFSVVAYTVSRQTHEIGIRMALGAARSDVLRMVLRMGLRLIGGGLAAGVAASLGLSRLLSSQLFGVAPNDPATMGAVIAVVAMAGFSACYFPARRATRVDPLVALRYE